MEGIINIEGVIGQPSSEEQGGIELLDVIRQVKKQPEATSFKVIINSQGGMVETGFDIFNYLRSLGVPITTVGRGIVASIATVIFMAGSKRIIEDDTAFMIHLPMGSNRGTADEMTAFAKRIKKIEKQVVKFYSENFGLSSEAIEPLLRNETWMSREQLDELGITTSESTGIAAIATIPDNVKQKPKTMSTKKDDKSFMEQVREIFSLHNIKIEEGKVENKTLLTADLKEVVFPEVDAAGTVAVNHKATIDGQPIKGEKELLMQDGRTFVFSNGALTSIKEAEEEKEPAPDFAAQLATMQAEVNNLKTEKTRLETELAAQKKLAEDQGKVINMIAKLETDEDVSSTRDNQPTHQSTAKKSRFAAAITNIKK